MSTILQIEGSSRLRFEREQQDLSLRELAHFAACSHMTIQRAEVGTLDTAPATKARIARALRVPVRDLWPLATHNDNDPALNPGRVERSPGRRRRDGF